MRRRAISSVVGTVFAVIALTTTVAYVSYSMNTLSQYNQAVIGKNLQTLDLGKEKFQVSNVAIASNKFNITVANTGSLPINFTKIWVQNTSATDWVRSYVPANNFVGPSATLKNIGQNIPAFALTSKSYHIKLVTSRGNSQEFNVDSANSAPLNIQFYALPSNVDIGYTTELVMVVTNNGSSTLTNIVPNTPIAGAGAANYVLSGPTPASYNTLPPGSTAVFKWDATMSGQAGQSRTFNATLVNGYNHNYALSTVTLATVSSLNAAPLNIQLLATPSSVVGGFKTELLMMVTNNGTGTLTNLVPNVPTPSGLASCTASSVSPASYNTLPPGSTAIFKWDVTVIGGGSSTQTCTYTLTQPLQNGYFQTVQTTISTSPISFTSTNLAANTGVLTINYTSFRWEQGNGWKPGWVFPAAPGNQPNNQQNTGFSMNVTNNNSTMNFYIDNHTQSYFSNTNTGSNLQLFIINSTNAFDNTLKSYTCPNKPSNYCQFIPAGKTVTLYFGTKTLQSNDMTNLGTANTYMMQILLYGKFAPTKNAAGTQYAQDIPFIAVLAT